MRIEAFKHCLPAVVFLLFIHTSLCTAQSVGINKTNPTEALDVNGNIQLNGTLLANGNPGQNGQALYSTGTGLQWLDAAASGFKRFRTYINTTISPVNFVWQKPEGVTEVMIEAWAGGGGGSGAGGGSGGGYAAVMVDVSQATQINLVVGNGGNSNTTTAGENGGNTVISWNAGGAFSVTVPGGLGASNTQAGASNTAFLQTIPASASLFTLPGNPGAPIKTFYSQNTSTTFAAVIDGGRGGGTYKFYNNGGAGVNYAVNASNTAILTNRAAGGGTPGGGGGSSSRVLAVSGNRGGGGLVIIRW